MGKLIKFGEGGSHWYLPDGTAQHDATLREARKQLLYPSVTSIDKDQFVNTFLENWKKEQVVIACLENPRQPHETPEDYAERVYTLSLEKSRVAAEFGQRLHAAIDGYPAQPEDISLIPWVDKFGTWYQSNIQEKIGSEITFLDHQIGVAGRTDLSAIHREHGRVIVDYKTQGIKADDKGRKKPKYYDSWVRQLAFYASCDAKDSGLWPKLPKCISVVIDSTEASDPYMKVWEPQEIVDAYHDFVVGVNCWCRKRGFWPVGEWKITPSIEMPYA